MLDIFWSPSSQEHNAYAFGNTVEETVCNKIADRCDYHAKRHGYTTARNRPQDSYIAHRKASNLLKPRYHIPIHTNAGGGRGVTVYGARTISALAKNIYDQLSGLTPVADRGVKTGTFEEIVNVNALVAYLEIDFHDSVAGATWILANIEQIAISIVKGILKTDRKAWIEGGVTVANLKIGQSGVGVAEWQNSLNRLGHNLQADGVFGPATDAATRAFQSSHGLTADGVVGPASLAKMIEALKPVVVPVIVPPVVVDLRPELDAANALIVLLRSERDAALAANAPLKYDLTEIATGFRTALKY